MLQVISTLQRTLDALDIEGLSKLHAISSSENAQSSLAPLTPDPSYEEWGGFVAAYRTGFCSWDHANPDPANIRSYLMAYLLSATFKDCSIILRIKEGDRSPQGAHSVSIIDLDQKSINRLGKWEELDRTIVARYRSASRQKRCIDQ